MRAAMIALTLSGLFLVTAGTGRAADASERARTPEAAAASGATASAPKVLRYAIRIAETGFDPARVTDLYSRTIISGIFDAPLRWDYLARPHRLKPAGTEMPQVSEDFRTLTFKVRPGLYFAPDPVFQGKKRELTAHDYVYSIKRHYDPVVKSGNLYLLENARVVGMAALREAALKGQPFDYDREVEGLRALDRYTFQVKTETPDPRLINIFADAAMGAVAREVVEAVGDRVMEHPVGTGAWRLTQWRRSSLMVLEKNPNFREEFYNEQPDGSDPRLAEQVRQLQGRRLPMIDRVEISVIEENQPRWLSFLQGQADFLDEMPQEFAPIAIPRNRLAPNLAQRGIQSFRYARSDVSMSYFNMEDPVVGGYTPDKVALRRAISLALDVEREIRLARRGQAIPAQGPIAPLTYGYDPSFRSTMSSHDLGAAKALLDTYGYTDRNGDGWREQPDGSPLQLNYATEPDGEKRQLAELWQKAMNQLGVRIRFQIGKWPENLKAANAGRLQMWGVGWSASVPDGDYFLGLGYGGNKGQANKARFDLPAFNRLFEQQKALPNGDQRLALMREAERLMVAYMPYKFQVHRIYTDMAHPWVMGYSRNLFVRDFWTFIDINTQAQAQARR